MLYPLSGLSRSSLFRSANFTNKRSNAMLVIAAVLAIAAASSTASARFAIQEGQASQATQSLEVQSTPSPATDNEGAAIPTDSQERSIGGSLSLYGGHIFSHDLDDGGDVAITRAGAKASVTFPIATRNAFTVSLGAEGSWYDFSNTTGFGAGNAEPWEDIRIYTLEASYFASLNDRWSLILGASIESGMEEGADFNDSLTYTGILGATYSVSKSLSLGLGAYFGTRLEDDAYIFPIPFIQWQIDEKWRLGSRPSTRGGRFALSYQATETVAVFAFAGFESRDFRLDNEGANADGIGRDRRIPVGLGVDWSPNPQISVDVIAGVDAWSQYTLDDSDGDEISEQDGEVAPFIGAQIAFQF